MFKALLKKRILLALGGAVVLLVIFATMAFAWDVDDMNYQIEHTNVIVSGICSGTIIDVDQRLVLTAHHCITDNMREVEKKEVDPITGEITVRKVMERTPMYVETWKRGDDLDVISSRRYKAVIKGWESKTDLAILQVVDDEWKPTMAARLAPSDFKFKRGLPVWAVGNPGIELDNSVTTGIISAPARAIDVGGDGNKVPYFQHSASIMGGSSGGAIYNDNGEIIGTVSAGYRAMDAGLAVPVSEARRLLEKLKLLPKFEVLPPAFGQPALGPR